jgi:hypothetical protein
MTKQFTLAADCVDAAKIRLKPFIPGEAAGHWAGYIWLG